MSANESFYELSLSTAMEIDSNNKHASEQKEFSDALKQKNSETIFALLKKSPTLALEMDSQGRNALMQMLECNEMVIAKQLIDLALEHKNIKELITMKDKEGATALAYALRARSPELVSKLLNLPGINIREQIITVKNEVNEHLLMEACRAFKPGFKEGKKETVECIKMLEALVLDHQGRLAIPAQFMLAKNPCGEIILFQAIHHGILPLVKTLLRWYPNEQWSLLDNYFMEAAVQQQAYEYQNLLQYTEYLSKFKSKVEAVHSYLLTFKMGYIKPIKQEKASISEDMYKFCPDPSQSQSQSSNNSDKKELLDLKTLVDSMADSVTANTVVSLLQLSQAPPRKRPREVSSEDDSEANNQDESNNSSNSSEEPSKKRKRSR